MCFFFFPKLNSFWPNTCTFHYGVSACLCIAPRSEVCADHTDPLTSLSSAHALTPMGAVSEPANSLESLQVQADNHLAVTTVMDPQQSPKEMPLENGNKLSPE